MELEELLESSSFYRRISTAAKNLRNGEITGLPAKDKKKAKRLKERCLSGWSRAEKKQGEEYQTGTTRCIVRKLSLC